MKNHYKGITLKELCELMNVEIPERLKSMESNIVDHVAMRRKLLTATSAYLVCRDEACTKKYLDTIMEAGANVIFVPVEIFENSGLKEDDYPFIFITDFVKQVCGYYAAIRKSYDIKTVSITGTLGKTTTREFISSIVSEPEDLKAYCSYGNKNSYSSVAEYTCTRLTDDLDLYVQETGGGGPLFVEKSAAILCPDVFVLTNVQNHHLNRYITFEALFEDKVCTDKYLSEDGVVITNYDDEAIAAHTFIHKVVSFGITTEKEVDYRGVNIVEKNGTLEFDIVSKDETVHVAIDILGTHNVYNALAAYATGKQVGISTEDILEGLANYTTTGIRQNYKNVGGYHVYADCYNVSFSSIDAGLAILDKFELGENAKRHAVIGGENKLGPGVREESFEYGKSLKDTSVDYMYFNGKYRRNDERLNEFGDARSICRGLLSTGYKNAVYVVNQQRLIKMLKENVKQGDMTVFKGIYSLHMPIAIDAVFGSSFVSNLEYYTKDAETIEKNGFIYRKIPFFSKLELKGIKTQSETVAIPNRAGMAKIYRISAKAFANNSKLKNISFGKYINNIGPLAFFKCKSLKQITIPSHVLVLEAAVFKQCTKLETVTLEHGVRHIGKNAFYGCKKLKDVYLPETIGRIENHAFEKCPEIVLHCKKGSYAESYAISHKLNYIAE